MSELEQSTFEGRIGQTFTAQLEDGSAVALELAAVTGRDTPGARAFALELRGPLDRFLPQRTYVFTHVDLGELPIFVVPVGRDGDGFRYEAIFSRLV